MNRKMIMEYGILLAATGLAAFFQTFALKANIGVTACWDSVGMNLYDLCGLKVGTASIILGSLCVLVQWLILRKDFHPIRLLQVPVAILYGQVMNVFYYDVFQFEVSDYGMRVLLWAISVIGMAFFLGITTSLDLIPTPTEGMCYVISERFPVKFGQIRLAVDVSCVVVSVLLSLLGGVSLKVREGTLAGALLLGPLMGTCMKKEKAFVAWAKA